MRSRESVDPTLSAKACEQLIASIKDGTEFPTPARLRRNPEDADVARFVLEDGDIDGDDGAPEPVDDERDAEDLPALEGEHTGDEDDDDIDGDDGRARVDWPKSVLGHILTPEAHGRRGDLDSG